MALDFRSRLVAPDDTLTQKLDDELVLLSLSTQTYFGLNEVGAQMWEALKRSPSIEAAYEELVEFYDVDPATLRKDLEVLIQELLDQELVTLAESESRSS